MKLRKILLAILISLPLIPLLILPAESMTGPLESKEITMAIPFMLELFGFFAVYKFVKGHKHSFSDQEKKALMVLACGAFWILGLPVVILAPTIKDLGFPLWSFYLFILYAFINLVINTRKVITSADKINSYFLRRYLLPGGIASAATLIGFGVFNIGLNGMAVYFLVKNFIDIFERDNKPTKVN